MHRVQHEKRIVLLLQGARGPGLDLLVQLAGEPGDCRIAELVVLHNCFAGYRAERDEVSLRSCVPKMSRDGVRRSIGRCLNLRRPTPESVRVVVQNH